MSPEILAATSAFWDTVAELAPTSLSATLAPAEHDAFGVAAIEAVECWIRLNIDNLDSEPHDQV